MTSRIITVGTYPAESCDYVCFAPLRHHRRSPSRFSFVTIGVRGGGSGGGRPTGLKKFRPNSVFRASASCSKILSDKKYFNTVKNSRATLFFKPSASCSKILNDQKYVFSTVNSGHTLFFRASTSCSKLVNVKSIFNRVKNFWRTLFSRASAKLLKNPEW